MKKRGRPPVATPKTTPALRNEMRHLRKEGWKLREIARKFDLSWSYTQKVVSANEEPQAGGSGE